MENILDITIILPIKSAVVKDFEEYFDKAVQSVKNQKLNIRPSNRLKTIDFEIDKNFIKKTLPKSNKVETSLLSYSNKKSKNTKF